LIVVYDVSTLTEQSAQSKDVAPPPVVAKQVSSTWFSFLCTQCAKLTLNGMSQVSEFSVRKLSFVPYRAYMYHLVSCGAENIRFWRIKVRFVYIH
jgi:hypothetical protein